jgi:hypothetical protein
MDDEITTITGSETTNVYCAAQITMACYHFFLPRLMQFRLLSYQCSMLKKISLHPQGSKHRISGEFKAYWKWSKVRNPGTRHIVLMTKSEVKSRGTVPKDMCTVRPDEEHVPHNIKSMESGRKTNLDKSNTDQYKLDM